jgi:hypothetical protein
VGLSGEGGGGAREQVSREGKEKGGEDQAVDDLKG